MHTVRYKLLNQRPKPIKTGACSKSIHAGGAMILPCKMLLFAQLADRGGFGEHGSAQTWAKVNSRQGSFLLMVIQVMFSDEPWSQQLLLGV